MINFIKNFGIYILEFAFLIMFFGFAYFLLIVLQGVKMDLKTKKEMRIDKLEWRLFELYNLKQREIFWIEEIKKLKLEINNG